MSSVLIRSAWRVLFAVGAYYWLPWAAVERKQALVRNQNSAKIKGNRLGHSEKF